MDRYYTFNADKFLKDSKNKWRKEKKEIMSELESITELKALKNSEVHGSGTSDPTVETAMKELEKKKELERIEHYEELCKYAFDNLNELDRDILTKWYYSNKRMSYIVDMFCNKYNCTPRTVYRMRRIALEAFKKRIEEGEMLW